MVFNLFVFRAFISLIFIWSILLASVAAHRNAPALAYNAFPYFDPSPTAFDPSSKTGGCNRLRTGQKRMPAMHPTRKRGASNRGPGQPSVVDPFIHRGVDPVIDSAPTRY
jgi:hypothetical protein